MQVLVVVSVKLVDSELGVGEEVLVDLDSDFGGELVQVVSCYGDGGRHC